MKEEEREREGVVIVELGTDFFLYLWFLLCNIVMSLCIYKCMHFSDFQCVCMYEILTIHFE